eukprot:EW710800.1.p2 GENE.EW710800.1~~EW710800.1.p2  ORF type:complete len:54 (+),score=1.04 EW710800.1:155-316(+)
MYNAAHPLQRAVTQFRLCAMHHHFYRENGNQWRGEKEENSEQETEEQSLPVSF